MAKLAFSLLKIRFVAYVILSYHAHNCLLHKYLFYLEQDLQFARIFSNIFEYRGVYNTAQWKQKCIQSITHSAVWP